MTGSPHDGALAAAKHEMVCDKILGGITIERWLTRGLSTYLRTLLADPRVKEEMASAIWNSGEGITSYDEMSESWQDIARKQAQACIDTLARMVEGERE